MVVPNATDVPPSVRSMSLPRGDFVGFFLFQCERIQRPAAGRGGVGKRLRPSRSMLKYISAIEPQLFGWMGSGAIEARGHGAMPAGLSSPPESPTDDELKLLTTASPELLCIDLAPLLPGSAMCVALFRALALYCPSARSDAPEASGGARVVLRVGCIDCTQCGLDNDAVRALCDLLASGRCALLASVVLDRNEYVAVEAGQIILRALGVTGPVGDGCRGASYSRVEGTGAGAAGAVDSGADATTTASAAAAEEAHEQSLRARLPCLTHISLDATHVPPHFIRRVLQLLAQ